MKMGRTLYEKVFDSHTWAALQSGQYHCSMGLQPDSTRCPRRRPSSMLEERKLKVLFPERTFATVDHIIPTMVNSQLRPYQDALAEDMLRALEPA